MIRTKRLFRPAEPRRGLWTAAVLMLVYVALVYVGVGFGRDVTNNSAYWPANGVVVAALLVLPRRLAIGFAATCFGFNFIQNAVGGIIPPLNLLYSGLNLGLSVATAWLTRQVCGAAVDLSRIKRLWRFAAVAALAAGTEAAIGLAFRGKLTGYDSLTGWWTWSLCDFLGVLLCAPAVLLAVKRNRAVYAAAGGRIERFALLGAVVAVTAYGFSQTQSPAFLAVYPLLILTAFRSGPPWVSASVMAVAAVAMPLTVRGFGPIALMTPTRPFIDEILIQLFLLSVFLCALPATNALGERNRAAQRLQRRDAIAREARAKAEEATQAKSRFLAVMSHEIRTPLNGIVGFSQALTHRDDVPADAKRQIGLVLSSSDILLALVNDILDFSKIEAGQIDLNPVPTALPRLLEEVAGLVGSAAEAKGLELTVDDRLPAGVMHLADDLRLKQILLNLANKAVKFTASGSVTIVANAGPGPDGRDEVEIRVIDTGIGIAPEKRDRLFQPFSQVDSGITRTYGGTGLGLVIAKSFVELMGGEIGVGCGEFRGSCFWFRLPLARAAEAAPVADIAADEGFDRVPRVLVVDDHPVNREVATLILTALGCEAHTRDDGVAAIEAVRAEPWDLVFMDIHMPGLDGYGAAQAIRALPGEAGLTPIIAMTADVTAKDVAKARQAGMDGHVGKPINQAALLAAMNAVFAGRTGEGDSEAA